MIINGFNKIINLHKLNTKNFPEQRQMTKDDTLIICGDFGAVWERGSGEDRFWQNWLNDKNCTVSVTEIMRILIYFMSILL